MILLTWHFSLDVASESHSLRTHAHAARRYVVNILPSEAPLGDEVRVLDCLRANNDLTSVLFVTILAQLGCPCLSRSTHQASHRDLDLPNKIEVVTIVDINHDELEVLDLFEIVGDREARLEVWVEIVHDGFGLGNLDPLAIALLHEATLRIRLAEGVQVLQFAARHK